VTTTEITYDEEADVLYVRFDVTTKPYLNKYLFRRP